VLIARDSNPTDRGENEATSNATSIAAAKTAGAAKAPAGRDVPREGRHHDHATPEQPPGNAGPAHRGSAQADGSPRQPAGDAHQESTAESHQDTSGGGCPSVFSHAECVAFGEAYQQESGGSHPVEKNQCPPAFTRAECVELGRAYRRASGTSKPVKGDECPPAFSHSECVAMGEAYRASK
jgi:hypothetical protein